MKKRACSFACTVGLCLAVVHVAMAQRAAGSQLTRVWSGTDQTTTQPFSVVDDSWNLEWTIEGDDPQLMIVVRDPQGNPVAPPIAQSGAGTGRRTLHTGPGTYSVDIDPRGGTWLVRMTNDPGQARVASARRPAPETRTNDGRYRDERALPSSPSTVQACTGIGSRDGQGYLGFGTAFGELMNGYSVSAGFDAPGPVTVGVSGMFADIEDSSIDAYGGGAGLIAEIPNLPISVCPGGSVSFLTAEEFDIDLWTGSAGIAVGGAVPMSETVHLNLFAEPSLIVARGSIYNLSDTETEFGFSGGLGISGPILYGVGRVSMTTFEASDPSFSVGVGVKF